jgi:hypothetical protein
MKRIDIIGNVALFSVIALIIYLSQNFSNYISLLRLHERDTHIQDAYVEQKKERISTMQRSVNSLKIKDEKLRACIENQSTDLASVDPRSTGGRYVASELDTLTCPGLGIRSLDGLEGMTKLKSLILFRNEIVDLKPLSNLYALERLDVSGNRINDISPIANLPKLTDLYLSGNRISNVRPLGKMTSLTRLALPDLQGILCSDLEYLRTVPHISRNSDLYVYNCQGRKDPKIDQILAKDRSEWTHQEEEAYLYYKINERKKRLYPRANP